MEGTYLSFVYVPVDSPKLKHLFPDSDSSLHITLSKPFRLARHQLTALIQSLRSRLSKVSSVVLWIDLSQPVSFWKQERCFAGFRVKGRFEGLLSKINETMEQFGQQTYFKEPIMHVTLSRKEQYFVYPSRKQKIAVKVQRVSVKFGNRVQTCPLK